MKILIADDDRALVRMLTKRLVERDDEVIAATNATEAWTFIQESLPDIIILDMSMPGGTGTEILQMVRKLPETSAVPVIIMSAFPLITEKLKDSGANDFIVKPFAPDELVRRIQQVTIVPYALRNLWQRGVN